MRIPFASSPRSSIGVEWELQLVDLATRELVSGADEVLAEVGLPYGGEHPRAKHELFDSTIEIITSVCSTVPEAKSDLAATLADVQEAAARRGLGVVCSGTHPFTHWRTQRVSPNERYERLVRRMQWMARRLQIFGVHVHVGVRDQDKAIPILNALTTYVPHLLALSASSPFWAGHDTGLASARAKVFEGLPTAGLPQQLAGWAEFEELMASLVTSGTVETVREVWWDIRPHPGFGTVELRICDGLPTLREVGAIAALSQCLVDQLSTQLDRGYTLPVPKAWLVRENKWRAARFGLDAEIVVDEHGTVRPLREAVAELADDLAPLAGRLGCAEELADVRHILAYGASYERQRASAREAGGDLRAVVDGLLQEMRADSPATLAYPSEPAPGGAAVRPAVRPAERAREPHPA